jgi:hypothetical protein
VLFDLKETIPRIREFSSSVSLYIARICVLCSWMMLIYVDTCVYAYMEEADNGDGIALKTSTSLEQVKTRDV